MDFGSVHLPEIPESFQSASFNHGLHPSTAFQPLVSGVHYSQQGAINRAERSEGHSSSLLFPAISFNAAEHRGLFLCPAETLGLLTEDIIGHFSS